MSMFHKRAANNLLDLCLKNGGVYIKLGQHIASLQYLLPEEYTDTFRVLQDECTPSSMQEVENVFKSDAQLNMDDFFSQFNPDPIGVASLAQVHHAVLKNGQEVAVKIQHSSLDWFSKVDINTTVNLVFLVKKLFPDFEFTWLAEEIRESLPKELDFRMEAANCLKTEKFFEGDERFKVPAIYWSDRRILIMEYIKGGKINNPKFLSKHNINPESVSKTLHDMFFSMIFNVDDIQIHCDPHPGNIFVRPVKPKKHNILYRVLNYFSSTKANFQNFELVLLDHGLYRTLSKELKLNYAKLWNSILVGNDQLILENSLSLFKNSKSEMKKSRDGFDYHRLFASMLTGRSWDVISNKKLSGKRQKIEVKRVSEKIKSVGFFLAVSEVLAALPREILLLLKTNDLLRSGM
ncbi:hypothetical protein HK099_005443 [Clydaea vesicula]|uniref:ABC1 atypical kinase-like domain-containing protein n=1 Tax=Clydaea vesicula TaxID=447962 RepID=A0AAD5TZE6_9FUNG|nr:hypothetical protein HK099_005443 [Clydaea vesicula]